MAHISPFALGATLYMPATRPDILEVMQGAKVPGLRSLVICLEDAVAATDVQAALDMLRAVLVQAPPRRARSDASARPLVFIRPRDALMAAQLNDWPEMAAVDGFVLPKLTMANLSQWAGAVCNPDLLLMPTLETRDVFHPNAMADLGHALRQELGQRVLALRIGGNDLMSCLGLRRNPLTTLYQTPMGYVIPMLAGVLGAQGYALTGPVFEQLATPELLSEELHLDIAHGLVGKTAIHPAQVAPINEAFRVSIEDLNCARMLVNDTAPAVFRHNDAMLEPATHHSWAVNILERAKWHGVKPAEGGIAEPVRLAEVAR